jgi:hypothetical protein
MTVLWPLLFHDDVRHDDHVQVEIVCITKRLKEKKRWLTPLTRPPSGGKRSEIDCRPTMIDLLPTFDIDLTGTVFGAV